MAIQVQFDKNGWYHPAFGRLGRGDQNGKIYELPDVFGQKEEVTIPVMDRSSKPPRKIDERKVTRYKLLPSTVRILGKEDMDELVEEARDANEPEPKPVRPRVADSAELDKAKKTAGRGAEPQAQSAQERTTGKRPSRREAK